MKIRIEEVSEHGEESRYYSIHISARDCHIHLTSDTKPTVEWSETKVLARETIREAEEHG